eukprot:04776.XXX_108545_108357_1 [CDS] Oithona nana genome sequencing.
MGQSINGDQAMVARPMADYIPNDFEGKQTGGVGIVGPS